MRAPDSSRGASAPLTDAITALAERALAGPRDLPGPLVLGVNGPQGCGKSTLAAAVVDRFTRSGRAAIAISIDDFYLSFAEQRALAARFPGNPYLEHRGYPGTHDVALGARTLAALRKAAPGDVIGLPVYDKSAHRGRGDRLPESSWTRVRAPLELVVLEGWMVGFPLIDMSTIEDRHLADAAKLTPRYSAWNRHLDAFVHLEAADPSFIVEWRVDAERTRRAGGASTLTDEEARDYIQRFLPAYALWVPPLRAAPPHRDDCALPALHVVLGRDREPLTLKV